MGADTRENSQVLRKHIAEERPRSLLGVTRGHLDTLIICIWVLGQCSCDNLGPVYLYHLRSLSCFYTFTSPLALLDVLKSVLAILHNLSTDSSVSRIIILFLLIVLLFSCSPY